MEHKIEELTRKIYNEGVEKGEEEAKNIVENAQSNADKIILAAKKQAEEILSQASLESEEYKKNVEKELILSGQQSVNSIKQQITDLLLVKVVDNSVVKLLSDPAIIKEYMLEIIKKWDAASGEIPELEIILPDNKKKELEDALKSTLQKELDKKVEIEFSKHIKGGFQIGPKDGSYKISLSDENFIEFFKEYLRPKTRKFLFGE